MLCIRPRARQRDTHLAGPSGSRWCLRGLSHFVIDTELDKTVLEGLANSDESVLSSLPKEKLQMVI